MKIVFVFLLMLPCVSFANNISEFLKFQDSNNYYIYKDKKDKWIYECSVEANRKKIQLTSIL